MHRKEVFDECKNRIIGSSSQPPRDTLRDIPECIVRCHSALAALYRHTSTSSHRTIETLVHGILDDMVMCMQKFGVKFRSGSFITSQDLPLDVVIDAISRERLHQDHQPVSQIEGAGVTTLSAMIVLLDHYLAKIRDKWAEASGNLGALDIMRRAAAVCVQILERGLA